MKSKQYLTLGIGMIAGFGVAIAGISHALKGGSNNTKLITAEKAKTIMKNKVPGASISEFSYDTDDKLPKYDATLIKDNYEYEIDINAKTGEIIKFEKEKKLTLNNDTSNENNNSSINNQDSVIKENSQQNNINNNTNTNAENNVNKNISSNKQSNSYIGEAKAKSIMLNKVPNATIKNFYLDNDDNTPEYEAELVKGNFEYDISIDAKSGAIKEFNKEYNKYDNDNDKYDDKYDDDKYDNDDDKYDDDRYDHDDNDNNIDADYDDSYDD